MSKSKNLSADAQLSVLSIDKNQIIADGKEQAIITIQLKDADGKDATTSSDNVILLVSEQIGVVSELTDNKNGTYVCTVTSTTVGTEKFNFTLNGVVNQSQVELKYIEEKPNLLPPITPLSPPITPENSHQKNSAPALSQKKVDKRIVEFLGPHGRYCKGDIAGFDANYANELVNQRKIAIFYKK